MFSFGDLMSQNVERQGNIIESNFLRYCQFPAMFLHWSVIQQRSRWRRIHSQRSTLRNPFDSYTNIHNRIFISSECYIHNRIFSQRDIPRKAVTGSTGRSRRVSQKWFTKFASKRSRLNCKNRRDAAGCYVRSSSRGGHFRGSARSFVSHCRFESDSGSAGETRNCYAHEPYGMVGDPPGPGSFPLARRDWAPLAINSSELSLWISTVCFASRGAREKKKIERKGQVDSTRPNTRRRLTKRSLVRTLL